MLGYMTKGSHSFFFSRRTVAFSGLMRFQQSSAVKKYAAVKRYSIFGLSAFATFALREIIGIGRQVGPLPDLRVSNLGS